MKEVTVNIVLRLDTRVSMVYHIGDRLAISEEHLATAIQDLQVLDGLKEWLGLTGQWLRATAPPWCCSPCTPLP